MSIFSDKVEDFLKVFKNDFSVVDDSFSYCLDHLGQVLKRWEDTNLVLNWEKCHFMVKGGIVLGHKISEHAVEVGQDKIYVIAKLPPPILGKGEQLTSASVIVSLDWSLLFEMLCDASGFSIGSVLGQISKEVRELVADHLSRLEEAGTSIEEIEINSAFPDKRLLAVSCDVMP
ncbi:uncharacterized protein LOC132042903, partial [Lycium ferocissimum]|uniref:uncharacterized protein LOC132042903 n=1 Tax=Lycium ferocissimum TaxID=112874 RepID=UPI0028153FF6